METIISLLVSTSFVLASCRASPIANAINSRDIVEIGFPRLVPRRLAVLDAESTANSIIFPTEHEALYRTFSSMVHLLGVSVIAYCLARRTDRMSAKGFISMPLSRTLVIIIFIDSWAFMFSSGLLVEGVGLSLSLQACSAGIFLCICLYAVSKLLIYWFLVEKVYLVHPHFSHTRIKSPVYRICISFVIGYAIIIALAISGRITYIRNGHPPLHTDHISYGTDGACVIGLGRIASLSLLVYDLALNVFFTFMFLLPIYRSSYLSQKLRWIAKRTLVAATVSLITSAVNVLVLTWFHGQELGWICLASCGMDVIVNAIAIFFVTATVYEPPDSTNNSLERSHHHHHHNSNNPGIITTRGILEVEERDWQAGGKSIQTRSVHFSPDSTPLDRTLCTTLGVITEKELEEGKGGKDEKDGKSAEGKTPPSKPYPPVRTDQNARRTRPGTGQITVSRLGQTIEKEEPIDPSSYASFAYSFSNDYPRPGTPEDTTLEVRKEITKRTWDLTIRSSKTERATSNPTPNTDNDDDNDNGNNSNSSSSNDANLNSETNPSLTAKRPRSRSGSFSSLETATPASPPPSSTTHVTNMANMAGMVNLPNAKRKRLSLTTNESHDTILLNSSNFTPTPGTTPTSTRFPSAISRSLTSTPIPSNLNNSNLPNPIPPFFAQRLSPSPNESSSSLSTGTPRTRPLSTILAEPDPEEIRDRMSVLAAVTEATSTAKTSTAAKIANIAMGKNSSHNGRKRSNTDSDALGPPTPLEVSIVMETTHKVEQRTSVGHGNGHGKSRSRDGRGRRERRSRESSMILDDYHGTTYNRGRSYSSSGGL